MVYFCWSGRVRGRTPSVDRAMIRPIPSRSGLAHPNASRVRAVGPILPPPKYAVLDF